MAITMHGGIMPISFPIEGNEVFWDQFLNLFDGSNNPTAVGSTLTVPTSGTNAKLFGVYQWNALAGSVLTLPPAVGSMMTVKVYVAVLATSNSHILYTSSANAVGGTANNFVGRIGGFNNSTGAYTAFAAAATSNTITLNRAGTGSVSLGEYVIAQDVAPAVWQVTGELSASGAAFTTPFSHT